MLGTVQAMKRMMAPILRALEKQICRHRCKQLQHAEGHTCSVMLRAAAVQNYKAGASWPADQKKGEIVPCLSLIVHLHGAGCIYCWARCMCCAEAGTVMLGKLLGLELQQYADKLHKWHVCTQQTYNEVDYARVYYRLHRHKRNLHSAWISALVQMESQHLQQQGLLLLKETLPGKET